MKVRELEALLESNGWKQTKRTGTSHRKWKKGGKTIGISGNATRESDKGQEKKVLRELGLK